MFLPLISTIPSQKPALTRLTAKNRLFAASFVAIALLLAYLAVAAPLSYADAFNDRLAKRVENQVKRSGIARYSSVYVWDQDRQEVLYSRAAHRAATPASTQKLITSAAALNHFGADHVFTTELQGTGHQSGAIWRGHIYLVGGGDPLLSSATFSRENYGRRGTNIARLADALQRMGITRISGNLYVDDSYFDALRWVGAWPARFRFDQANALGALTVNHSSTGRWAGGYSTRQPALHAGETLRSFMQKRGIKVAGKTLARRAPASAEPLASLESAPLTDIVRIMNTVSDNFIAENLLKHLSAARNGRGSTAHGARVATQELKKLGVSASALKWVDGSGLAYQNRVSARLLGELLMVGAAADWGEEWIDGFAVSGTSGTLRRRMTRAPYRNRVRAKTGTLRHVSALAGFSNRATSTRRYGFVVITFDPSTRPISTHQAHRLQDQIATTLVK